MSVYNKKIEILELLIGSITGFQTVNEFHDALFTNVSKVLKSNLEAETFMFMSGLMCSLYIIPSDTGMVYSILNHTTQIRETKKEEFKELLESDVTSCIQRTPDFMLPLDYTPADVHKMCGIIQGVLCSTVEDYIMKVFSED
jgi:hypothetical protein